MNQVEHSDEQINTQLNAEASTLAETAKATQPSITPASPSPTAAVAVIDTRSPRARRWSRVESVTVKNFKAILSATVPLGNVTILVGPNGSGKSSVLQAVHWAARAASYIAPKNSKEMMSFDRIDYLPSSEPLRMAHKGELRSETRTEPTAVIFNHAQSGDDSASSATVKIFAARNKGGVSAHIDGGNAVTPYKQRASFITAYIPGLAGLSERETVLAQPQLRRQAASGDAGSVLRNVLLNITSRRIDEVDSLAGTERLKRLNELLSSVHPGLEIRISFDEREDYSISANFIDGVLSGDSRPLETAATGVLQVIQIFAYLILFKPKLLLIDEPDAHLHPDKQERLVEALEAAAREFDTQIILTTHSPHIARAASAEARLVWMQNGEVKTQDDVAIRRLLGWGGLDKKVLFFVEDEDDVVIRTIMRQWPELARSVTICRCFGIENLPKDKLLSGLLVDGELGVNAIIHRDNDFMTPDEVDIWRDAYKTRGTIPWVTAGVDVEAYFCEQAYLAALYGVTEDEANSWRVSAAAKVQGARETFLNKRKKIVRDLYEHGGSPDAIAMWTGRGELTPPNVLGKKLLGQLKVVVKSLGKDDRLLDSYTIPDGHIVAPDLREAVVAAIGGNVG